MITTSNRNRSVNRGEEVEQAKLIKWSHKPAVRALMPKLKWLHHSPNGGKRSAFTGGQMKAIGVNPGFPDLVLPARHAHGAKWIGLVIEMKSEKGRASDAQSAWLEHFASEGWYCVICRDAHEARFAICDYFDVSSDAVPGFDDPVAKTLPY